MKKNKICLADIEGFVQQISNKFQTLGSNKKGVLNKHHEDMVMLSLKMAIKDNNLKGIKLRKKKNWLRGRLETILGSKSEELRNLVSDVRENTTKLKRRLRDKDRLKIDHLVRKYGRNRRSKEDQLDKNMTDLVGNPDIFNDDCVMTVDNVKEPVIVMRENETIETQN